MGDSIQVVPGIDFPLDAVTQKFAWLGRSGAGKSYAAKRFVEQLLAHRAQVVIVDTVGVWWGLRQRYDVPILGGLHGDIPLAPESGELVAQVVVDHGSSFVLDTSQMTDGARCRFMTALGQKLFELKKSAPSAMHVLLDEAQDIVPQNFANNETMMLHEWVRVAKQGRAFGIGLSLISQRPQEINKKALNQAECVLAFQLTGTHERKAIEHWLSDKGLDGKIGKLGDLLPKLEIGCPFIWSPQWLKVARECDRVLPIESADTSQTPQLGDAPRAAAKLRPIDLAKLRTSMAAHAEKVTNKKTAPNTPALPCSECARRARSPSVDLDAVRSYVKQAQLGRKEDLSVATHLVNRTKDNLEELEAWVLSLNERLDLEEKFRMKLEQGTDSPPAAVPNPQRGSVERRRERVAAQAPAPAAASSELPVGELRVLTLAYQSGASGITMAELSLATSYKARSLRNYVQRLRPPGKPALVERTEAGTIVATEAGAKLVPKGAKKNPTGNALIRKLIEELPTGEGRILGLVLANHPHGYPLDSVVVDCPDYKERSVRNYVQRLVTRRAVQRSEGRSLIIHADVLPR